MKKSLLLTLLLFFLISYKNSGSHQWGFFAHQKINRIAVYTLPTEMITFYKANIQYITENAVNPDKRRYAVEGEAPRHYIDLNKYGDSAVYKLPRYWFDAVEELCEDTLMAHGIVPWHVQFVAFQLTKAFEELDATQILRLSADLGHYIADANVPLHTTSNYNGQLSGQYGIHGFWESRLPELYSDDYDFFVGKANYIENTQLAIWEAVEQANLCLDSVFTIEKELSQKFKEDEKYSSELRGNVNMKVYSRDFSKAYHLALSGQVERQMRNSIKMVGDFWYTCWVNAGQPDLSKLLNSYIPPENQIEAATGKAKNKIRNHESFIDE